jgi:hypothetical protein
LHYIKPLIHLVCMFYVNLQTLQVKTLHQQVETLHQQVKRQPPSPTVDGRRRVLTMLASNTAVGTGRVRSAPCVYPKYLLPRHPFMLLRHHFLLLRHHFLLPRHRVTRSTDVAPCVVTHAPHKTVTSQSSCTSRVALASLVATRIPSPPQKASLFTLNAW